MRFSNAFRALVQRKQYVFNQCLKVSSLSDRSQIVWQPIMLYVVNFINRQTLYHSIGTINKIIWGKCYTDSCSATIIILNNVATPKNCTITRLQCYFRTVCRLNVSTEQCLLCFWRLPSVYQESNRWDFAQWSKKLISKISETDVRVPSVSTALGWHKQLEP